MFLICFAIGFIFLMQYGKRVKKDRLRSIMADDKFEIEEDHDLGDGHLTRRHVWIGITAITLFGLILFAVQGMYAFQTVLNFFIPSASGQAMVSMPLMVPLAYLLGISRQTAVLAFIAGDGYSNIIIPTNGVLMAILGIAAVPFEKWFRFIISLFIILALVAGAFLSIVVMTGD
jgi:uncharacterized ion transporter superfamily protein YfcC